VAGTVPAVAAAEDDEEDVGVPEAESGVKVPEMVEDEATEPDEVCRWWRWCKCW